MVVANHAAMQLIKARACMLYTLPSLYIELATSTVETGKPQDPPCLRSGLRPCKVDFLFLDLQVT